MKRIKLNLLKLRGAEIKNLGDGIYMKKEVLCIPIEELYKGEKGLYLNLVAFEMQSGKSEFLVKQSAKEGMSDEERKAIPILGDISSPQKQE